LYQVRGASATIDNADDFSIVANATTDIFVVHRALKRTAKFKHRSRGKNIVFIFAQASVN